MDSITGLIMSTPHGTSANITFKFKGYNISIANDTSCKNDGKIRRSSLCVFKSDTDKNVTSNFKASCGQNEMFAVCPSEIFEIMKEILEETEKFLYYCADCGTFQNENSKTDMCEFCCADNFIEKEDFKNISMTHFDKETREFIYKMLK